MLALAIILIVYGLFVMGIAIWRKPAVIWKMGKIQGFVKILGDLGTRIFFMIFGAAAVGFGIFFLLRALSK